MPLSRCPTVLTCLHIAAQMVERKRTPAEIREEYERLQREREERRLQQRTNPKVLSLAQLHQNFSFTTGPSVFSISLGVLFKY